MRRSLWPLHHSRKLSFSPVRPCPAPHGVHGELDDDQVIPPHPARTTPVRLSVRGRTVPKELIRFAAIFADDDINIVDIVDESREDVAHNIIVTDVCPWTLP